jgi:hypothetical protein
MPFEITMAFTPLSIDKNLSKDAPFSIKFSSPSDNEEEHKYRVDEEVGQMEVCQVAISDVWLRADQ